MADVWKIVEISMIILALVSVSTLGIYWIVGSNSNEPEPPVYNVYVPEPTPEPTPEPIQNTNLPPLVGHIGEKIIYENYIEWAVTQTIRGSQANSIVASGNMFNSEPTPGYEYFLYKIYIKNIGTEVYSIYPMTWAAYADGVGTGMTFAVLPDSHKELESIDIRSGASVSGWIVCEVPIGSNVRIYYEPLFTYGYNQEVYFVT